MACTATATPKVAEEIVARLGLREPERVRSGFDRPNLSFDVLPFDGEGSVARKRATLLAGVQMPENRPAVVYCGTRKSTEEIAAMLNAPAYHAGMPAEARTRARTRSCAGRRTSSSPRTRSAWASTRRTSARSGTGRSRRSLEAYYQEAGRAGRDGAPARAVLLASRTDLGRLVRFIHEAEVTVEQVVALINRLRAQGDIEMDPGQDRDRIRWPSPSGRARSSSHPAQGGRVHIKLATGGIDRGRIAELCRAAKDRRWQAYRTIEHYAATGDRCRRRQLLDHFGDQSPGAPTGRCCDVHDPPDWLPADHGGQGQDAGRSSPRTTARPSQTASCRP